MIEFGRAPVDCAYCGPSHALVRDSASPSSMLSCDDCDRPIGTVGDLLEPRMPPISSDSRALEPAGL